MDPRNTERGLGRRSRDKGKGDKGSGGCLGGCVCVVVSLNIDREGVERLGRECLWWGVVVIPGLEVKPQITLRMVETRNQ